MSYTIDYKDSKVLVTFDEDLKEGEITTAFLEIVDVIDIKDIKHIIFDCSRAKNYTYPKDFKTRVQVVTRFSTSWNSNINIIFVATNPQVIYMVNGFINHDDDLKWKYHLFENLENALVYCNS